MRNKLSNLKKKLVMLGSFLGVMAIFMIANPVETRAAPNTTYNYGWNGSGWDGDYYIQIYNTQTDKSTCYKIYHTIRNEAYDDNRYKVDSAVAVVPLELGGPSANDLDIDWSKLGRHTDRDGATWLPDNIRQYVIISELTLNMRGYHLGASTDGDTQSYFHRESFNSSTIQMIVDTNAMGITDMMGAGIKHDYMKLTTEPNQYKIRFHNNDGTDYYQEYTVTYDGNAYSAWGSYSNVIEG